MEAGVSLHIQAFYRYRAKTRKSRGTCSQAERVEREKKTHGTVMNSAGLRNKGDTVRNLVTSPRHRKSNQPSPPIEHEPRVYSVGGTHHRTAKTPGQINTKSLRCLHKLRQTSHRVKHRFSKPRQADFKYASASQKRANISIPATKQAQKRGENGGKALASTSVSHELAQAKANSVQAQN